MFEHYLFHDRDIDTNLVFSMAYAVFGSGQACAYAATESKLLNTILDIATAWYTGQCEERRLIMPPQAVVRLDPEKAVFRGKKGLTIFGHIRVLFRHAEVLQLVVSRSDLFQRAVEFIGLFVGIQPQKRELGEHVEYEVEWPRTFQILGELAKCCRELGEGFVYATPEVLLASLAFVANRIFADMMLMSSTLDPMRYKVPSETLVVNVLSKNSSFSLIHNYMPAADAFSFHQYYHLLWAEMFKSMRSVMTWENGRWNGATLQEVVDKHLFGWQDQENAERLKLMLIEWPLQSECSGVLQTTWLMT